MTAFTFAYPASPRQRGTNENTNGLLRQYFPKGTSLAGFDDRALREVENRLNNRPRKVLGWRTRAEICSRRGANIDPNLVARSLECTPVEN